MAQVDFSNAVLDVDTNKYPLRSGGNMTLYDSSYGTSLYDEQNTSVIVTNLIITPTFSLNHATMVFTGTFTASGSGFIIGHASGDNYRPWKVSNISFSTGDTFSFAIDIDISIV